MTTKRKESLKCSPPKKQKMLTIKKKLELIEKFEKGKPILKLAKYYSIGVQTVRDIIKKKTKLEEFAKDYDNVVASSKRKSMKKSSYENLDIALHQWYDEQRSQGIYVTCSVFTQKARLLYDQLGIEGEFNASIGWLSRFKHRHGIWEQGTWEPFIGVDKFTSEFTKLVEEENLKPDQIYSADVSTLHWKSLPTKINGRIKEKGKLKTDSVENDHITFMCCGNASGNHKLKLVVVGMENNSKSFQSSEINNLPVQYYNEKGLRITVDIFENWFKNNFVPEVQYTLRNKELPEKALLLFYNTDSYSHDSDLKSEDGLMVVKFLTPRSTPLIQPTDQRVSSILKKDYRASQLKSFAYGESGFAAFWKKFTMIDAIHGLSREWFNMKPLTLGQSWKKLLPTLSCHDLPAYQEDITEIIDIMKNIDGFQNVDKENVDEWLKIDIRDEKSLKKKIAIKIRNLRDQSKNKGEE